MTDTRSSSALFKRAEQMKRWEESETNRQPPIPRKASRIKFSSGCVFLAACTAGEKEEVQRLLKMGADINTANVDGLTALHQACIDDNLDMVEFLVSKGADVNCGDNEGWTPLHATASCGFISMARFLLESGADVGAVNYDGDLPVDIAESDEMENLLKKVINEKGIDCDYARNAEERTMLAHAQNWAATGEYMDLQHPKTGATPLHVAAAKGYTKIVSLLLNECNVDVDALDFDGWTSLHAAALWGQKESAELLIQHGADMDIKNYSGQTCFDLVDPDIAQWLEEMRKTLGTTNNNNNTNSNKHKRGPPAPRDPPNNKLKRVEVQITNQATKDKLDPDNRRSLDPKIQSPTITSPTQPVLDAKPPKAKAPSPETPVDEQIGNSSPEKNATLATDDPPSWRRSASFRSRQNDTANTRDNKLMSTSPPNSGTDTILRRTHSFENDKTFYQRYLEVTARIKASSCPSLPPIPQSSLTALDVILKKRSQNDNEITPKDKIIEDVQYRSPQTERRDAENYAWILSPSGAMRRSLVPPIRDEESETQRKAHAKRVRETRRSTQGVTLDEIKSAEQFVKKKTNNVLGNSATPANNNNVTSAEVNIAAPNGIKKTTPAGTTYSTCSSTTSSNVLTDTTASNNFELEEVNKANAAAAAAAAAANNPRAPSPRLSAATVTTNTADTTVTLPLRRQSTSSNKDGKGTNAEEEKEVSPETRATTQAALNVIQRRRRPKRRSTGVGHVDMDDIVNDRGGGGEGDTESESIISQSGTDSKEDTGSKRVSNSDTPTENGAIDYKALWEASQAEVKKLKEIMKSNDQQLRDARATIERVTHVSQNSLTELEKREKRAMERKLSEMEEELKQLQKLKAENERLRTENRALTRVVSKLTNSAGK